MPIKIGESLQDGSMTCTLNNAWRCYRECDRTMSCAAKFGGAASTAFAVLGVLVVTACTSALAGDGERGIGAPLGSLNLSGPTFGKQTVVPTQCVAGEHQLFLGFDLRDEKSGVVTRLLVDPATGPVVRVFVASAPFDRTILFPRSQCHLFHFSLDPTGWRINRIDQLDVSLELDCQLPGGDGIAGKASEPRCR